MSAKTILTYLVFGLLACNNRIIDPHSDDPLSFNKSALVVLGNNTNKTLYWDAATTSFKTGPTLSDVAGSGAHTFQITKGTHTGKYMIIHGSANGSTSVYDPSTKVVTPGPVVNAVIGTVGAHSFAIKAGPQAGKRMVILIGTTQTAMYDPTSHSFLAGPAMPVAPGDYSINFTGVGGQIIMLGAGSTNIAVYNAGSHTISLGAPTPGPLGLLSLPGAANPTHIIMATIDSDQAAVYAGDFSGIVVAGYSFWQALRPGVHVVKIETGMYANHLIGFTGGSLPGTLRYYQDLNYQGPASSQSAGPGAHGFIINGGPKNGFSLHILAGNTTNTAYFDPTNGVFQNGPALPVAAGEGAFSLALQ